MSATGSEAVRLSQLKAWLSSLNDQISALEAELGGKADASSVPSLPLAITNGGTGNTTGLAASATQLATARTIRTNLASTSTASFNGTADITPGVTGTLPIANGGTGNTTGLAASATQLATARTIRTDLASTSTASFNGTANITPGVTGTLPVANGGTGVTSLSALASALGVEKWETVVSRENPSTSVSVSASTSTYALLVVRIGTSSTLTTSNSTYVVMPPASTVSFMMFEQGSDSYLSLGTLSHSSSTMSASGLRFPISGYAFGTSTSYTFYIGTVYGLLR